MIWHQAEGAEGDVGRAGLLEEEGHQRVREVGVGETGYTIRAAYRDRAQPVRRSVERRIQSDLLSPSVRLLRI